jgi:hypothetical protein
MKPVLYLYVFFNGQAVCAGVVGGTSGGPMV